MCKVAEIPFVNHNYSPELAESEDCSKEILRQPEEQNIREKTRSLCKHLLLLKYKKFHSAAV